MKTRVFLWTVVFVGVLMTLAGQAFAECLVGADVVQPAAYCPALVKLWEAEGSAKVLAIYFTTNGKDPVSGESRIYSDPIKVSDYAMIKFQGVCADKHSGIVTKAVKVTPAKDLTDEEKEEKSLLCRPCSAVKPVVKPAVQAQATQPPALQAIQPLAKADMENKARVANALEGMQQGAETLLKASTNLVKSVGAHVDDKQAHLGPMQLNSEKTQAKPTVPVTSYDPRKAMIEPGTGNLVTKPTVEQVPVATEDDIPQPAYKTWWFWTTVGVVAAGAAVGVVCGVTDKCSGDKHDAPRNTSVLLGNTK